jgi:hypothetical protein
MPLHMILRANQIEAAKQLHDKLQQWNRIDTALELLNQRVPSNMEDADVLLKVAVLNQLYRTNLYAVPEMASHIVQTFRMQRPPYQEGLVEEIAKFFGGVYLSFASKYCHFFVENKFLIFDQFALKTLHMHLGNSAKSKGQRPRYADYCTDINTIRKESNLHCSTRELDRYLWLAGLWHNRERKKFHMEVRRLFEKRMQDSEIDALIRAAFGE